MITEPTFLGVSCRGPNPDHAKRLRKESEARLILAQFYELDRKDQLLMAAMVTEMVIKR